MRGETEKQALDRIVTGVFCKNGVPSSNPFTGKTYLDATDREFDDERVWYINSDCYKSFYGLTEEDRFEIESILRKARPNTNPSQFPDFIFDNGFIEHFKITSSKTTRKGATHQKEEQLFLQKVGREAQDIEAQWSNTPDFDNVRSKTWTYDNPAHNYEYLCQSFKNSWQHHISSMSKYQGNKTVGIFLIEYPETVLTMCENAYADWVSGMSQGDMRDEEKHRIYRLSRDKKLLDFIFQEKEAIKYVLFVNEERFEIIKTASIPYLQKLMPWEYCIYPLSEKNIYSIYNSCIPYPNRGENDE